MTRAFGILCMATVAMIGSLSAVTNARAENISIEGWISTTQDQPVANVNVTVWRQSKVVQSALTDKDGHYSFSAAEGSPIDAITFDPPDMTQFGPGAIDHLSGKRSQKIGAVLYETGELSKVIAAAIEGRSTNVAPLVGQKNQLKRVMSLETAAGASKEKMQRYASFAAMLAKQGTEAEAKIRDPNIGIPTKGSGDRPQSDAEYNRQTAAEVIRELGDMKAK